MTHTDDHCPNNYLKRLWWTHTHSIMSKNIVHCLVTLHIIDCADLTITTDKLMELFASVDPEKVYGRLDLPKHEVERIRTDYHSPAQRKEAYLDLYVHQHPCPSWQQVAEVLRDTFRLRQQADFVEDTYVKGTNLPSLHSAIPLYTCTWPGAYLSCFLVAGKSPLHPAWGRSALNYTCAPQVSVPCWLKKDCCLDSFPKLSQARTRWRRQLDTLGGSCTRHSDLLISTVVATVIAHRRSCSRGRV